MKKHLMLFCLCTTMILGLCSCSSDPSFPADQVQQMENIVADTMSTYHVPGVIVAVWVPGKGTWIKGFGQSDVANGRGMSAEMPFRIGSLTKSFTATVILKLSDEGKLNLDDTIDKYITDPVIPNAGNITIRQLASMTSGLFNYTEDMTFLVAVSQDPLRVWAPKELVTYAIAHSPYFAPGASYYYSNTNFILLGMIIEKVTGNSLASEIHDRIILPLHLSDTSFATSSAMPSGSSHGYAINDDGVSATDATTLDPSLAWAAGANISTIYDLKKWIEAIGNGSLLSDASHTAQITWVDEPGSQLSKYGLGIMKLGNFIGHGGIITGFNSSMMYLPSNGSVFIVMENLNPAAKNDLASDIFVKISKVVLPNDVSW